MIYKIPLLFVAIGFATLLISFSISYKEINASLTETRFQKLTATRESKIREIESYFNTVSQQLITLSSNLMTVEATQQFSREFARIKNTPISPSLSILNDYYLGHFMGRYQQSTDENLVLTDVLPEQGYVQQLQIRYLANQQAHPSLQGYGRVHDKYHGVLKDYQRRHELYDLFLVNGEGDVVYSVFKEIDFATNLKSGPHKDSGLGEVYNKAWTLSSGEHAVVDYRSYVPSYGAPALFIATPVYQQQRKLGVLVFQLSIERIDRVMGNNHQWLEEGYGETGETYIVGGDFGMRNNSRFLIEAPDEYFQMLQEIGMDAGVVNRIKSHNTSVLFQQVHTEATRQAMSGRSDTEIILDYRGVPVLSSYAPLAIPGLKWVLLSELDEEEAFATLAEVKRQIITFGLVLFIVLVAIAVIVARRITNPLSRLVDVAKSIAKGDYTKRIPVIKRDEVGELSKAFNELNCTLEVTTISRDYADKVFNSMSEALFVLVSNSGRFDDLRIQTINQATRLILNAGPGEIIYRTLDDFVEGGCHPTAEELDELRREGVMPEKEKMLLAKDGRKVPVRFSLSLVKQGANSSESSLMCVCVVKDESERRATMERLRLASTLFNSSVEPALVVNKQGVVLDVNPAFEFAFSLTGVKGMAAENLECKVTPSLSAVAEQTKANIDWRGEVKVENKNGTTLSFLLSCSAVINDKEEVTHYVMLFSDISDLKEKEERIRKIAHHDALTGLPNRLLFNDRLEQAVKNAHRQEQKFALMFLDLDGFKAVNDTHGHQAGDELLIEVAKRLSGCLRENDTVARLGGDEFVVIQVGVKAEHDYLLVANNILQAINQPYVLSMTEARVSTSIGISCYPDHALDRERLVELADDAMYRAKKSGKNCIELAGEVVPHP